MSPVTAAREQLVADVQRWNQIADHRTGGKGDRTTDAWLAEEIRRCALRPELAAYPFDKVELGRCDVEIEGQRIAGVPLFDGSSLGAEPLTGRLGDDVPVVRVTPFDQHPLNQALGQLRRATDAPALIAVSAAEGVVPGLALVNAERYREPGGPAVLQMGSEHAARLTAAMATQVKIHIDFARHASRASNVGTVIHGSEPEAAPVVVMTPKSAWWTCTAERIGGIAIWLRLMRHFAASPPERTLLFTANSGHELSHLGLDHFLATRGALARDAHLWIHLGANFAARDSALRIQASEPALLDDLATTLVRHNASPSSKTDVSMRPFGEARNIFDQGGRFVSLLGSNRWFHHPLDLWPESVDINALDRIAAAVCAFAERVARV